MSVFRVKLQSAVQGLMDIDPSTGRPFSTSKQRSIYVQGPKGIHRKLKDGDTFTDSNYYMQFVYPNCALEDAFLEVVTDDGSSYSDVEAENVYPLVWLPGADGIIGAGDTSDDDNMELDIVGTYGAPAVFVQIQNTDSASVQVILNGSADATFTLDGSSTQIFNSGDIVVTKIGFDNSASGAGAVDAVEVILSIKSKNYS
jgi:hypothetical protein